jgi:hypothetical protein
MITLPAYFGDSEKQRAFVALIAPSVTSRKDDGSLFASLAAEGCDRVALYDKTGFPVSLLEVIDQIYLQLAGYDASEFVIAAFALVKAGRNVTDVGWHMVEHALTSGIKSKAGTLLAAARQAPAIFPGLHLTDFTEKKLKQMHHQNMRKASKMGHEIPRDLGDPCVTALLEAAIRGGEGNAGAVIQWTIAHAPDPEGTVQSYRHRLIELLVAA